MIVIAKETFRLHVVLLLLMVAHVTFSTTNRRHSEDERKLFITLNFSRCFKPCFYRRHLKKLRHLMHFADFGP